VKRAYDDELAELSGTYSMGRARDVASIAHTVRASGPMLFVGSGGALAVAQLAADLHMHATGALARATTPLEAATSSLSADTGLVLFTARGKHPDARLAVDTARSRGVRHLGVVTTRSREDLPESLGRADVRVATVPSRLDGFLATNSLLAMATAVCMAHDHELPEVLPSLSDPLSWPVSEQTLVITGPGLSAVGTDLEARLAETGLSAVQLTDYRNVAHGRHVGIMRNQDSLTVVAVSDAYSRRLAEKTLHLFPSQVQVQRLVSTLSWPNSVLDLLVGSMHVTGATGRVRSVDPGRPGVATFGRRLYHLPVSRLLELPGPDPVQRKLSVSGGQQRRVLVDALAGWHAQMAATPLRGVVLDYDGTCCPTWERFDPPPASVQGAICTLLDAGLRIGFATGRGKSLHEATRTWIPESHWQDIHVGLYNGSCLLTLADDPPSAAPPVWPLTEAADRLEAADIGLQVERRATQLTVSSNSTAVAGAQLLPVVRAVLARPPALDCKIVASGHSVDVLTSDAGKVALLSAVQAQAQGAVLAIGDQGQVDGNDFELLAAVPTSVSVDLCSADPTRCWNLDKQGLSGPALLVKYLDSLKVNRSGATFRWRSR
jgi:hypothetical protein